MTAPFAPELISPKNRGSASAPTVTLTWKFRTPIAGDTMNGGYYLRRRQTSPTPGPYEWWTGTSWDSSNQEFGDIAGTFLDENIKDGTLYSVTIGPGAGIFGWDNDKVYQWTVKTVNAAGEAGPYAPDNLLKVHAKPAMVISFPTTAVSRPTFSWAWTGGAGFYQKTYRLAIYPAAVRNSFGFNPNLLTWQLQATWIMWTDKYSSSDYKRQIDSDLTSGVQYYYFYKTVDNSDYDSGWIEAGNFTPVFTNLPAPALTLTPDMLNGVVGAFIKSAFNLLDETNSVFSNGIGNWIGSLNSIASWDSAAEKLILTATGMSYAAMDALHTTYAAADTAYTTYAVQAAAQAAPTGTARAVSGDQTGERFAVLPGTVYSAIATVNNQAATNRTGKLGIRWFKSTNVPSTVTVISQGPGVTLGHGADTPVSVVNVTSPSDAAFAVLEFEWTTAAIGDVMKIDDVAMAASSSVSWSPTGSTFDIRYVLERSLDQINWTPVWGMSRTTPQVSDSPALTQATNVDRSVPLGTQRIYYRAYAISKFDTTPIWSAPAFASIPGMDPIKWFLRRTSVINRDVRVIVNQISVDQAAQSEVIEAEGRSAPLVSFSGNPKTETVSISMMSLDKTTFELVMEALRSNETLYLQTNLDGYGYYLRIVDSFKRTQRRAVAPAGSFSAVRNLFDISFAAVVVEAFV